MHRPVLPLLVLLVVAGVLGLPDAGAKRRPKPQPCPGGDFLVLGDPLVPAGAAAFTDLLRLTGGAASVDSGCAPTRMKVKATRRGTRVRAVWSACNGLTGRVRLSARIEPITCALMVGKLRAKKLRRTFEAVLQEGALPPPGEPGTCGDGVVDGDERCDDANTASCDGCAGDCFRYDATCGDGVVECGEACDGGGCPTGERCDGGCRCVPDDSTSQVCTEASTCDEKRYCGDGDCRCIRDQEGAVRCGSVPGCNVPKCTTNADCAVLGQGYFCDTPYSGCCSDWEQPRCIAPCTPVPDPDNVLPGLPIDTQRLLVEANKLKRGLPADVDGDGTVDLMPGSSGDVALLGIDEDGDGRQEFWSQRDPAGNETDVADGDSDGKPESMVVFEVGPPPRRVVSTDTNLDGVLDHRETSTYDVQAGTVRVLVEDDPRGDGTFATTADTVEPLARDAGGGKCDGAAGFPVAPSIGSGLRFGPAGDISVPYNDDGSGGRCTKPRAQRIVKAVDCALDKGFKCLDSTNRALAKRLLRTVARETLYFGCGNGCAGTDATTIPWLRVPGFRDGKINFNPLELDSMTDDELCGVTLHEMLHWAGEGLGSPADHDQGHDTTYSCGRYCGRCISRGPDPAAVGLPSGRNADCARCAGTEAEKGRCGIKKQEIDIACPDYNLCHAGLAGNLACQTCRGVKQLFCDDSESSIPATFRCCQTCPSGYRNTDKPCSGSGDDLLSCGYKPPECP